MEESFVCSKCGKANDSTHLCAKGGSVLNHIQRRLSSLHHDCEDRPEISARGIKSKLERMNKITPFLPREEDL